MTKKAGTPKGKPPVKGKRPKITKERLSDLDARPSREDVRGGASGGCRLTGCDGC